MSSAILSDIRALALGLAKQLNRCPLPPVGDRALARYVAQALGASATARFVLTPTCTLDWAVAFPASPMVLAVMVRTDPHWDRAMIRLMIDRVTQNDRIGGIIIVARSNMLIQREANGKPVHVVLGGKMEARRG